MDNHCKIILTLLLGAFFQNNADGQNIRGDSIYVDANSVVSVFFPSSPDKAELAVTDGQEGLYKVNIMGQKSLSILALKPRAKSQDLEVTEGKRKHLFVISYKEGSPARSIDLSSKRKLSDRSKLVKKVVAKELEEANKLFDQAKTNRFDPALWEKVEIKYSGLARFLDPKESEFVKSRLEEIRKQLEVATKEKNFNEALKEGQNHYFSKNYEAAKKAYLKALTFKPGDVQALKYINLTDSVWAKSYVDLGDAANKTKKYVLAKVNYQKALDIKPDYPLLREKFNEIKKDADPEIYKMEKKNGDEAMKADDFEEARRAYDSALSVKPDDEYIKAQLRKVRIEEEKIVQEEKQETEYQHVLAVAKGLADEASTVQEYDSAIKEYERASDIIPTRKFPKMKIQELTKIKRSVKTN